jgi:exodeoxyribonuclease V alpha subunit
METLFVRVEDVVFRSEDFHIFSASVAQEVGVPCATERGITCKGNLFGIRGLTSGVPIKVHGNWVFNPKYGRQFDVQGWSPWSDTLLGVESFLRHCLGVLGEPDIRSLVDTLGMDTFRVLSEEPTKLNEVPGFDDGLITLLLGSWNEAKASSDLSGFFSDHSVTAEQMKSLFRVFGSLAKKIIEEDPYRLLEVPGFHFVKADDIAQGLGISTEDPRRYEGAVLWVLRESIQSGHLCIRRGDLAEHLKELIRVTSVGPFDELEMTQELFKAVGRLECSKRVVVDPQVGVYLPNLFKYERDSAKNLARFITPVQLDIDLQGFLDGYESLHQIQLSEAQKSAVEKLITNRVLVLTGTPGTGKTTVLRTVVELFQRSGIGFSLMAPTGIAAKRLSSVTGHPASTIHRALRYTGDSWGYNANNKYSVEAVIADEASMIDMELFYRLLDALDEGTFLVLVGDDAQLDQVMS